MTPSCIVSSGSLPGILQSGVTHTRALPGQEGFKNIFEKIVYFAP